MERIRVAAVQYGIRPVASFETFRDQVEGLVDTAADSKCRLIVFPEYFTLQLLSLGEMQRPINEQLQSLAGRLDRFLDMMQSLATSRRIHIVAGTIPSAGESAGVLHNDCHVFGPDGTAAVQGKLHMTRYESEDWLIAPRNTFHIFETDFGRMAVTICYDVEFPELARAAARAGATLLVVPSCTDDRRGFQRVRTCAAARAIENQMYVVQSVTVGSLPAVPAISMNYGQAAILTPSDHAFSRDGILAEGVPNEDMIVIGELDFAAIAENRGSGTVLPLRDSARTAEIEIAADVTRI